MFKCHARRLRILFLLAGRTARFDLAVCGLLGLGSCGDGSIVDPNTNTGGNSRGDGDGDRGDGDRDRGDGDDDRGDGDRGDGDGDSQGDGDGDRGDGDRGDGDGDGQGDGDGDVNTGDGDGDGDTGDGDGDSTPTGETGRLVGFTKAHHDARARVVTMPALSPLTWDPEIAKVAQAYAEKLAKSCSTTLVHSTREERNNWGENIAWFGAYPDGSPSSGSAAMTVGLWEDEKACYTLGVIGDS